MDKYRYSTLKITSKSVTKDIFKAILYCETSPSIDVSMGSEIIQIPHPETYIRSLQYLLTLAGLRYTHKNCSHDLSIYPFKIRYSAGFMMLSYRKN